MSIQELNEYRQQVAQADQQAYLGHIVMYDVSDLTIKHSFVKAQLEAVGLERMVTGAPCDADLFRRAFSNGQRRKHATSDPKITEQLLIRTVSSTSERIVRRVVSELVDAEGETLSYEEVGEAEFNVNHPDRLQIKYLQQNANGAKLLNDLADEYRSTQGCLDGNGIRAIIGRTLAECFATNLRGKAGGVYFVSSAHAAKLQALEAFAETIPDARVHSLPLVDDRKQRDLVKRAIDADMSTSLEKAMAELEEVLRSNETISQRKFTALTSRVAELKKKASEYSGLLETTITGAQDRLDILAAQVGELFGKVA